MTNVIERALQIARTSASIEDVKRQLIREGYVRVNTNLSDWKVRRQLLLRLRRHPNRQLRER